MKLYKEEKYRTRCEVVFEFKAVTLLLIAGNNIFFLTATVIFFSLTKIGTGCCYFVSNFKSYWTVIELCFKLRHFGDHA